MRRMMAMYCYTWQCSCSFTVLLQAAGTYVSVRDMDIAQAAHVSGMHAS
jgi:hypothetical protein